MTRRSALAAAPLLVAALTLAGCGSGSGTEAKVSTDSSGTKTVDVTFENGKVTPAGSKVEIDKGKPLKLHIVADEAGEIHVHSEPEQEIQYAAGTTDKAGEIHVHSSPEQHIEYAAGTTDKTVTIDQPGVVDVESHTLDELILQLEVR
jgi:hypothetical protein